MAYAIKIVTVEVEVALFVMLLVAAVGLQHHHYG